MSDKQETLVEPPVKVTTTKPKDPKKVAAGKRLGQISKQIRERKMREKIEAEKEKWCDINYSYLIGISGLVLAAISVYYARAEHKRETEPPTPKPPPETVRITKLDSL